jgi:hypothetical protein
MRTLGVHNRHLPMKNSGFLSSPGITGRRRETIGQLEAAAWFTLAATSSTNHAKRVSQQRHGLGARGVAAS